MSCTRSPGCSILRRYHSLEPRHRWREMGPRPWRHPRDCGRLRVWELAHGGRVTGQDGLVQLAKLLRGLKAEFIDHRTAPGTVQRERVSSGAELVQGAHELDPEPLAERVPDKLPGKLRNDDLVVTESQICLCLGFGSEQPIFLECRGGRADGTGHNVCIRRAAPQRKRLSEQGRCLRPPPMG